MSWFKFKGVDSRDMRVIVSEFPPDVRPMERLEEVAIPGRHGALAVTEGADGAPVYDSIDMPPMLCAVLAGADMDKVRPWLSGSGPLILGNDPARVRQVRMTEQAEYERIVRGRPHLRLSLRYTAQPFRYLVNPATLTLTSAQAIQNPGTFEADPIITLTGSGSGVLMVGGKYLEISEVDGVVIDCEAKLAYSATNDKLLLTSRLTGDWPVLGLGMTPVSWGQGMGGGNPGPGITKVEIQPNWRWL